MYYILANKVGVFFDQAYQNKFGAVGMEVLAKKSSKEEFQKAVSRISVFYSKTLQTDGCMNDGDYYYNDSRYVDAKLGVQIDRDGDCGFVLRANQDCPEWFMCMLEMTMLKAGVTFAHCAALEKDGKAVFMPARGGVGKTATVVKMVQDHGWRLLGDDMILLDMTTRSVFPFQKKFVIYGYHKDLFPQLFKKGKGPVKNNVISHMMTRIIPATKKMLRHVPALLAYAREHNPQQIRVYPKDIFRPEELSSGADRILRTIWLERIATGEVKYVSCEAEEIASRCAAITMSELTYGAMNLNDCLFTMCGSGMLCFEKIYNRIFEIVKICVEGTDPHILSIPKSVNINHVSDVVFEKVNNK